MRQGMQRDDMAVGAVRLERARAQRLEERGHRVLVDRIWPRGVKRADLHFDERLPEIAPSTGLRRWFGHDPAKWDAFRERYARELDDRPQAVAHLRDVRRQRPLILVYDARDPDHNHAAALRDYLLARDGGG